MNEGFDILNDWTNWPPEVSEALVTVASCSGYLWELKERTGAGLIPPDSEWSDAWREFGDAVRGLREAIGRDG